MVLITILTDYDDYHLRFIALIFSSVFASFIDKLTVTDSKVKLHRQYDFLRRSECLFPLMWQCLAVGVHSFCSPSAFESAAEWV